MIALATCAELPDGDPDDRPLPDALGGEFVVWDDPSVHWSRYERVVIRSTWDYAPRREAFLAWARSVGDRLINPPELIAWNTDKRYLEDLAAAGIPVVPTTFVPPGEGADLPAQELVVKPAVSAGSRDTARFGPDGHERAHDLVAQIHATGRSAIVQPYIPSVDRRGETALLYFGGEYSHAIHKGPLLQAGQAPTDGLFAEEEIQARTPTPHERALADRVITFVTARTGAAPVYARVDLVEDAAGAPLLLELELTEPSLFFSQGGAPAVTAFAQALRQAL